MKERNDIKQKNGCVFSSTLCFEGYAQNDEARHLNKYQEGDEK